MNKSILTIVLASLALPAMALLNPTQQAKLDNAWSVLTANGVNPTVMKNNINVSFNTANTQAVYDSNVNNFGQSFLNSNSIARQGKESFFTVAGGKVTSGNNFVQIKSDNGYFKFIKEGNTFSTNKASSTSAYTFSTRANEAYDYLTSNNPGVGIGASLGINRLDSKIKNANMGGEVGSAIQDKAHGLKATIRNLGRLEAATELAKSVQATCVADKATNACTGLAVKFTEIGSSIETVGTAEYFTTPSGMVNASKDIWYEDPNNPSMFINASSGATESRNNLLVGFNLATHYAEVSALDLYEDSLNDINDIAGAYIDITGSENFLFGDLTDLNGNTSSGVTNSTLSGLGI